MSHVEDTGIRKLRAHCLFVFAQRAQPQD